MLYPFKFTPIFKSRLWGGHKLAELFSKPLPAGVDVGESWELSGLDGDESVAANGPLAGTGLRELVRRFGSELLGSARLSAGQFPLLIKLLDARQRLSVQVHPGRAMVDRPGSKARLKNECWFVLDAAADARIWIGLEGRVGPEEVSAAIQSGRLEGLLHVEPAGRGDFFYLPAGTVHALGGGLVVAEVQTPSDTTYRLFDWNRVEESTGRPRPLHVAEALESIDPAAGWSVVRQAQASRDGPTPLVACEDFVVERMELSGQPDRPIRHPGRMAAWLILAGHGRVGHDNGPAVEFQPGDLILLPAGLSNGWVGCQGHCTWLEVTVPAGRPAGGP